jgi:hypothetical protein
MIGVSYVNRYPRHVPTAASTVVTPWYPVARRSLTVSAVLIMPAPLGVWHPKLVLVVQEVVRQFLSTRTLESP